ncbi:MAG: asparagine synthase C-terminal domain-containing protein, partial [Candidatus Woesearchaeota archaeon]|nr:asparagine synthase C-terminal domain-containing protein [Candidatus Woesearchaeota archaeon]
NELTYARKIADYFETDHKEIIVQPETSTLLPKIVWHNDEPMSDPTCIPTYLLSEQTKKKCTVVLTGEGADEDLGGYFQYKMMNAYDKIIRKLPRSFRSQVISPAIQQAPPGILNKFFKYASELGPEGLKRFDKYLKATTQESAYLAMVSIFDDDELKDILKNPSVSIEQYTKPYFSNKDPLVNAMGFENQTLLPENLLMKVDKMTMAFGVEARVPFLDHNVAEFCSTISSNQKIRRWKEKFILRKSMKKLIPELARKRKKERFFVPINLWFQGELKEITQQLLDPKIIAKQGFFKEEYVTKALSGLETSSLFYSRQLWSLLNFQLWHNQFIENDNLKKPTQI